MIQDANLKPIGRDAVRALLFFFFVLKNVVEVALEGVREFECEFQRRRILARLERDDGLASHCARRRELFLGYSARLAQCAYLIADDDVGHRRAHA